MANPILKDGFVCFIDLLGFGSRVENAGKSGDPNIEQEIENALETIQKIHGFRAPIFEDSQPNGFQFEPKIHIFSDSAFIICHDSPDDLMHLLKAVCFTSFELMSQGFWIRGGLSFGKVSHGDRPWGPAINAAYKIESQIAKHPRIAISKQCLDVIEHRNWNDIKDKGSEPAISRDEDGVWSINSVPYVLQSSCVDEEVQLNIELIKIKNRLDNAFDEIVEDSRTFKKVVWLCEQWDEAMYERFYVPSNLDRIAAAQACQPYMTRHGYQSEPTFIYDLA